MSVGALVPMILDSAVQTQPQAKFAVDTGIITLGTDQILRLTIVNRNTSSSAGRPGRQAGG